MSMVRRLKGAGLIGALVLAMVLVLSPAKQASAQQGVKWTTGFQVQNLGQGAATVTIQLIDTTGTTVATINSSNDPVSPNPIAQGSNRTYFPVPLVSGSFNGSAIISANQPIAAILNILGNSGVTGQPYYSGSASGISKGSTDVMLPLILRNNSGISTWFAVQNVGTAPATISVQFNALAGTSYTATTPTTVANGASYTFDQSTDANLGSLFVGSARVTSTQPLAVIVNQVGKNVGKQTMLTYTGFPADSGSNSVALPMVLQGIGGVGSGISVQNTGAVPANVTITYTPNLIAGGATPAPDKFTLGLGGSLPVQKMSTNPADKYIGSALVTTDSASQTVVVIVNQVSSVTGSAYEGVNTSSATPKVSLPLLMTNNGIYTSVQCMNVGGTPTTITINYNPNGIAGGYTPSNYVSPTTIGANGSVNVTQNYAPNVYIGGGLVTTSPESNIVCIVNQLKPNAGDALTTYDGINY